MRAKPSDWLEGYRIRNDPKFGSDASYGNNGLFQIPGYDSGPRLVVMVSDGEGWEHASVSVILPKHKMRCPTWDEMAYVKDLFWDEDETVVEFHVPHTDHISMHDYVLHLWCPVGQEVPRPPGILVGIGSKTKRHKR